MQHSGQPNEVDDDQIRAIIESDRHVTMQEIEKMLKIPKSTIDHHIQRLELVKKLCIWIPHEFKEIHLTKRINACDLHLKHNEFDPFLKQIINSDEKWIVYNNVVRKRLYFLSCFQGNKRLIRMSTVTTLPHTSLATRQKLLRLCWEMMLHPPYRPELAPSDYYLF